MKKNNLIRAHGHTRNTIPSIYLFNFFNNQLIFKLNYLLKFKNCNVSFSTTNIFDRPRLSYE